MEPIIPFDLVAMMPAHATNGVDSGQSSPRCGDMASEALPLAQAKTAARQMLVSGLHDYRVTDFGAPDLNNLTVQCNGLDVIKREWEE